MQFNPDWFLHALGAWAPWALPIVVWWLSRRMRSRRQAFWAWLTDENFYKGFGFLGLLWPHRERKRVWPQVMEEAKLVYVERLDKARMYRGGQLPRWWVALANIRFLVHMAFHVVETLRTIVIEAVRAIAFRKANNRPRVVNLACRMEVRGGIRVTGVVSPKLVEDPSIDRSSDSPKS